MPERSRPNDDPLSRDGLLYAAHRLPRLVSLAVERGPRDWPRHGPVLRKSDLEVLLSRWGRPGGGWRQLSLNVDRGEHLLARALAAAGREGEAREILAPRVDAFVHGRGTPVYDAACEALAALR